MNEMRHISKKHANLAFFIPHLGCPHQCSFCDQVSISGTLKPVTPQQVDETIRQVIGQGAVTCKNGEKPEIAFFGGSFTAIDRSEMQALLQAAVPYVRAGWFSGIRISTRPDAIDRDVLELLKAQGVSAIELGCQSTDDEILAKNYRGHTFVDTVSACSNIRSYGFELGLQMMAGLYGDTPQTILKTGRDIFRLHPDTVRIYPVVVLKDTELDRLLQQGFYMPLPFSQMVSLCSLLLRRFESNGIKVIRLGLHDSAALREKATGGFYHPAFRELCENAVYLREINRQIKKHALAKGDITIFTAPGTVSKAAGHKKKNLHCLERNGYFAKIKTDVLLQKYEVAVQKTV